jgi:outer membrane biosynthesis protein TonB
VPTPAEVPKPEQVPTPAEVPKPEQVPTPAEVPKPDPVLAPGAVPKSNTGTETVGAQPQNLPSAGKGGKNTLPVETVTPPPIPPIIETDSKEKLYETRRDDSQDAKKSNLPDGKTLEGITNSLQETSNQMDSDIPTTSSTEGVE